MMKRARRTGFWLFAMATCLCASGCALLGPASIQNGRPAYNEAISATNSQQVLSMIVRMRYGEPSGLLAVTSVTANLSIQASAGAEYGIGPQSNYAGNIVPLSTGLAYEESPTISYAPVQGEKYLRQFLTPLPLDLTILTLGAVGSSPAIVTFLIKSINGVRNADFVIEPPGESEARFAQLVGRLVEMSRKDQLVWAQAPTDHASFILAVSGEGANGVAARRELYELLGLSAPPEAADFHTLPIHGGFGKPATPGIVLRTRSLFELFRLASASVDVPAEQIESGLAERLPPAGPAAQGIRIRRAKRSPDNAMIATKIHGWWYYIDGTDGQSKLTFRILESLLSVRMAEAIDKTAAPIVTVPASR